MTGSDGPRLRRGCAEPLGGRSGLAALGLAVLVSASACSGSSSTPRAVPDTSTTPASLATSPPSEQDQVLEEYRAFWRSLTPAANAPSTDRRQLLAPLAVDPELKSLLA